MTNYFFLFAIIGSWIHQNDCKKQKITIESQQKFKFIPDLYCTHNTLVFNPFHNANETYENFLSLE